MRRSSDSADIILTVAPNGARKTNADLRQIPITPEDIAREAEACMRAGASILHLHVRDESQRHSLDIAAYRDAIAAIRGQCGDGIVIQVTTEAVGLYRPEDQMALIRELKPEAASFAVRELVPDTGHAEEARRFFHEVREMGIFAQFILYSAEDIAAFAHLVARGVIPDGRHFVLLVLGKKPEGNEPRPPAQPEDVDAMYAALREYAGGLDVTWAVCAFGRYELDCCLRAVELGGHARVGFENNHHMADGTVAPDNAALIRQFTDAIHHNGQSVANAAQVREQFLTAAFA